MILHRSIDLVFYWSIYSYWLKLIKMTVMEECSRQISEVTGKQKEKVNKFVNQW